MDKRRSLFPHRAPCVALLRICATGRPPKARPGFRTTPGESRILPAQDAFAACNAASTRGKFRDRNPESPHASIYFQMHRMTMTPLRQKPQPLFPSPQYARAPTPLESGAAARSRSLPPRQNPVIKRILGLNARLTQRNRFIERSHAQPTTRLRLRVHGNTPPHRARRHRPSPRRTPSRPRPRASARCESFPARANEGYFGPGGARCHAAQNFCSACHFRDYSGSRPPVSTLRPGYSRPEQDRAEREFHRPRKHSTKSSILTRVFSEILEAPFGWRFSVAKRFQRCDKGTVLSAAFSR